MEDPNYFLEGVLREKNELQDFEGPLSLILMLLQKNKIEIRDIKIAEILDQYLAYLDRMQEMDLEIASEFIQMAAYLLFIKTRMLLSSGDEELSELEQLMASLEQLKSRDILESVRKVTPELKRASETGALYFPKLPEPLPKEGREYRYRHEPEELLKVLYGMFSRGPRVTETPELARAIPGRITFSVREKSRSILQRLKGTSCSLRELYRECASRSELVATFLSVLELCSMGTLALERTDGDYSVVFCGGDVDEILERIEEEK